MAMKVLVFTTVYPTPQRPLLGLFVAERIRHAMGLADVEVVAPLPWFRWRPSTGSAALATGPASRFELPRRHSPLFWDVPRFCKSLHSLFLAASAAPAIARLRRRFPFDLFDAHFGYPDGVAAVHLGRLFSRPVVVTLRGSEIDFATSHISARQLSWASRRARQVIAVSHELKSLALHLGVAEDCVRVIPNGLDTTFFML